MIDSKTQSFIIRKLLLPCIEYVVSDMATLNGALAAIDRIRTELLPFKSHKQNIRRASVPVDSPIHDATQLHTSDIISGRAIFRKEATDTINNIDKLIENLAQLEKHYPSVNQREYVVSYLRESVAKLDEFYKNVEPQQISFELPREHNA